MTLLEKQQVEDVWVITVRENRLDAAVARIFREEMEKLIEHREYLRIVLNLSKVAFMDSSGMGAIISVLKLIHPKGGFALCGVGEMVSKIFRLTRMHKIFKQYETCEEAVAALSAESKATANH
ncbi:MAG: STAS domain-containing protein [Desulfobacterales bacterium]